MTRGATCETQAVIDELEFIPDLSCDHSEHETRGPSDANPDSMLLVHVAKCPKCLDPAQRVIFCAQCVYPTDPTVIVCPCGLVLPIDEIWSVEAVLR